MRHLLSPLMLGPAELPNRIVSTAHQMTLIREHLPTDDFVAYHEARAPALPRRARADHVAAAATGRVTAEGGLFANLFAGDVRELIGAERVVLAQGRVPAASPSAGLRELGFEVRRAGDCASPRSLEEAILEGTMAVVAWAEEAGGRHAPAVQTA